MIQVARFGTRSNQPYSTISYYISSLSPHSKKLVSCIRGHWSIENRRPWVKDVIYSEDTSPQKAGYAPINLSILKTWVLTLIRANGYDSITEFIDSLGHNLTYLLSFCT
ncbi:MAG: ISAs1 family transposase [Moorea sp. SIO4A3]|nr:ISAs1 family transposase [Moorena sp. SIO4A3]